MDSYNILQSFLPITSRRCGKGLKEPSILEELRAEQKSRRFIPGGGFSIRKSWTTMVQLEGTKYSFLLCLGICIGICSFIYLRTRVPIQLQPQEGSLDAGPFTSECKISLPRTKEGLHRRNSDVEGIIMNPYLNCSGLIRDLHFITRPLSSEEEAYPLAFILTVHKEMKLLVRLLRAIYTPQNVYCIHVDAKAPQEYRGTVQRLVSCLPNAFLSSRSETVTYAGFSRLQADLNCMKDLVKSKEVWRKVVNLCGQDFPIMSNLELVRYMQSKEWRNKNMTPGVKQPATMRHRTQIQYREIKGYVTKKGMWLKKGPPPHNLQIYFGTAYYALTREFVDFVLGNQVAKDLLVWSKDTFSPDEHYWVTLNHIKEAPGSNIDGGWNGAIRAIKWRDQEGTAHNGCKGHYVRDICIYGLGDLPWIIERNGMFANKFESDTFPEALDCMEQWHREKVLRQATVPIEPSWLLANSTNSSYNNTNGQ